MLIHAIHSIWLNPEPKTYERTNEVDPVTGDYRLLAVHTKLAPGLIHDVASEEARKLIAHGAAREPSPDELAIYRLANGAVLR